MNVKFKNVTKEIKRKIILRDVSFEIESGDIFALIGPNGAGKTTLMRILLGLYDATAGDVSVDNISVKAREYNALKSRFGFLLDNLGLFKDLNAWDNIELFDRIYYPESRYDDRKDRISYSLKKVGLYQNRDENIKFFSRGMKQRLAVARAIINDPKLIILDEPDRGLDVEGRLMLREIVQASAKNGATVFISSHELNEMQKFCTKIGFLNNGELLCCGSIKEISQKYKASDLEEIYKKIIIEKRHFYAS